VHGLLPNLGVSLHGHVTQAIYVASHINNQYYTMSQAIPLGSRLLNYWRLSFSIAEVAADCREAPWYGPWSIAIQQMFKNFCPCLFVTITYPQYPVTKDINSIIPDEEVEDEDESDDEVCHVAPVQYPRM
jgi:hypothetical protein